MTERSRESELTGGYALMDQQDAPPLAKNNFFFLCPDCVFAGLCE